VHKRAEPEEERREDVDVEELVVGRYNCIAVSTSPVLPRGLDSVDLHEHVAVHPPRVRGDGPPEVDAEADKVQPPQPPVAPQLDLAAYPAGKAEVAAAPPFETAEAAVVAATAEKVDACRHYADRVTVLQPAPDLLFETATLPQWVLMVRLP
tara:strand:+ start:567 stop:1022 length:456 start_codon:yes stop_codon:yes gene_type:complete